MSPNETGLPLFPYPELLHMALGSYCPKNGHGYVTDLRERELIEQYNLHGTYTDVRTYHDEATEVSNFEYKKF